MSFSPFKAPRKIEKVEIEDSSTSTTEEIDMTEEGHSLTLDDLEHLARDEIRNYLMIEGKAIIALETKRYLALRQRNDNASNKIPRGG